MRCKKAEKLFSEYLLGDISSRHKILLEEHIDSCPACAEYLSAYRELLDLISSHPVAEPSDLYFDALPRKILAIVKNIDTSSQGTLFSPFRHWWKPVAALATAALVVLVLFNILLDGTSTQTGALPDFDEIEQSDSYTKFVSSIEDIDSSLEFYHFDTPVSGKSDTSLWYSDVDTVDEILLFTDEEQEDIFNEIRDQMS